MKKPTDSELDILNILWSKGPSSVREVHEAIALSKKVFYTTTLKTMQVMVEKGLLKRDTSHRSHIYEALIKREEIQKSSLNKILDTVFGGSTSKLVISALGQKSPTPEELKEIKSILEKLEKDSND